MKAYKPLPVVPYRQVLLAISFFLLSVSVPAYAASTTNSFYVDSSFDASARSQVPATLIRTVGGLDVYIEQQWWQAQTPAKQQEVVAIVDVLGQEFSAKIHPVLTSVFGSEWTPGVDGNANITVFFEAMHSSEGGYFNEADEYIKLQIPTSNEREMVYLSLDALSDSNVLKRVFAHEFTHLIEFNQKNRAFNIEDDQWLNEARADYSSTLLGYDSTYEGSNLQQRVNNFIENPTDAVTEWRGSKYDYASTSLFSHYLVDHYGVNILIDSLKSRYVGISSINYALQKIGAKEDFSQVFTNWTIASVLNDCTLNKNYCYLSQNLKNFRLAPSINFLPLSGNVSLSVTNTTKNWAGNWLKFIGGNGNLTLDFSSLKGLNFQVPYIISDSAGSYEVKFLTLDPNQKGQISIDKFGQDYKFLIIIPSLQSSLYQLQDIEPTYPYTYTITIAGKDQLDEQTVIQQLLDRIAFLKSEIAKLTGVAPVQTQCAAFNSNLLAGMKNSADVRCLQQFLKNQGSAIYPEGLVTGNFGSLTRAAVIRFQEKYAADILTPLGLLHGTGYVGESTRLKINQLINGN